jgi:hypothetical protein
MIFRILKSMFHSDVAKAPTANDAEAQIATLTSISNGLGEYASIAFSEKKPSEKNEKALEMLSTIKEIEKTCRQLQNSKLFYSIAIAYRNYCAWFVRGEDRKQYLEKCVFYLTESIAIDPDNIGAKAELGRLLIEEKVVRNLPKDIKILKDLKNDGDMPSHLNSILSKAHRQSGNVEQDRDFNLCAFNDPSPAVFREERKRFRALIKKYKKQNEIDKLKTTLNQYYNLAVLVTICYGNHDCNTGVIGWQYDEAIKTVKKVCNKIDFSFAQHGFLEESNFISNNDWKTFVAVFGESSKSFNPTMKFRKNK